MDAPEVTVLMPVFNAGEYLHEAIESILQQTFTDFELIVVNDASTDGSDRIVDSYRDPRIIRITNERNLGASESRNRGIRIAKGTYITPMDADDVSDRRRLESQISFLKGNPDIALVATWGTVIAQNGDLIKQVKIPQNPFLLRWRLLLNNQLIHSSVMVPSRILRNLGGYNKSFESAEDYELCSRIILDNPIAVIPDFLVKWRCHAKSLGSRDSRKQDIAANTIAAKNVQSLVDRRFSMAEIERLRDIMSLRPIPEGCDHPAYGDLLYDLLLAAVERWEPDIEGLTAIAKDCSRSLIRIASLSAESSRFASLPALKKAIDLDKTLFFHLPVWKTIAKIIFGPHLSRTLRRSRSSMARSSFRNTK